MVDGESVDLGPSSVLRVGVGKAGRPVRVAGLKASDLKLFVGRLWAKIEQYSGGKSSKSFEDACNAAVGVRG